MQILHVLINSSMSVIQSPMFLILKLMSTTYAYVPEAMLIYKASAVITDVSHPLNYYEISDREHDSLPSTLFFAACDVRRSSYITRWLSRNPSPYVHCHRDAPVNHIPPGPTSPEKTPLYVYWSSP